ncbi:MAG: hypothetical protein A3F84_27550 [Candidatus Handelsmanbacteria bacterium RIFCSPLOWO2_12_FULL_64_10]|uniref:Uncharacterized protein n=1 Tax=Handelsmanbacteria sp. (strain RIFCSPLOWO2_12_FULL_64_10) TaxID=1817868 RepID=A0A1F6C467_HANXR|nr:MAG: hypothetical protein A3F84_27550 [Candidatus Handelsmanbacteria bacterium RIFCSPLOWO2_12_FULL_64_10]
MSEFKVEVEEVVTRYVDANNGAGPMWCYGSPVIVREGGRVFVSAPETDPALDGLCKTRWQLFCRDEGGWQLAQRGARHDEREQCSLVRLPGGRLVLSVNPLADLNAPGRKGRCVPHLLIFNTGDLKRPPSQVAPVWDREYAFTEHSYRGIGVDYKNDAALLLNIEGHEGYAWSWMDRTGRWVKQGKVRFPIRACYPQVGLQNGAAHILAIGDIVEANEAWRAYKEEKTGRKWDYDFRRLFYTWTEDISRADFHGTVEVDSREETAGHIRNLDMWLDPDGAAHVLYATKNIWHDFMRDRFFPGTPIASTVEYRVIKGGKVIEKRTLATHVKDESTPERAARPSGIFYRGGAFHVAPDGKVRALFTAGDTGTHIAQVHPWVDGKPVRIALQNPLYNFFVPGPRQGSEATDAVDLFGTGLEPGVLRYARLRV